MNKRFTDIWCSETGHIGITDNGIDKEFTGDELEDFLNTLDKKNKQLMGYLIKIKSFDDDDIDAIFNRDAYEEWGEMYYYMKEESKLEDLE